MMNEEMVIKMMLIVDMMMMQTGSQEEAKGEHVFQPTADMGLDGTITEEQES